MSEPTSASAPAYVSGPSGRSTVSLVTSCVFTLSLCVWSAIHINVYRVGTGFWKRFFRKLAWAVLGSFMPEYVVWTAAQQLQSARALYKKRNASSVEESLHETTARNDADPPHSNCPAAASQQNGQRVQWTLYHGYFALMGGLVLNVKDEVKLRDSHGRERATITPWGILRLAEWNMLPDVPKNLIEPKCKSDGLAKALVCVQVLWMMIQTIARRIAGLPITLLEINTLAHIGCAIVLYAIWWFKPQDVTEPVIIDLTLCERCNYILRGNDFGERGLISETSNNVIKEDIVYHSRAVQVMLLSALSCLYGGAHALAWNAHFPSNVEKLLWRVASCIVAGEGFILLLCLWRGSNLENNDRSFTTLVNAVFILLVPYLFGRLFLITEAFIGVRSLPVGAYDSVTWINFWPHIG